MISALGKLILIALCVSPSVTALPNKRIGGGTDDHGCYPSAGYSWCESLGKCIRRWETPCPPVEKDGCKI